jgi:hypothetical protein
MSEHDDLEISLVDAKARQQAEKAVQEPVQHRRDHRRQSEPTTDRSANDEVKATIEFLYPTGLVAREDR